MTATIRGYNATDDQGYTPDTTRRVSCETIAWLQRETNQRGGTCVKYPSGKIVMYLGNRKVTADSPYASGNVRVTFARKS